jgi:simple sugar transport system permease protein
MINYQPQIICALGLTLVIASGEIDLSFPSVITLSSMIFAAFYRFDNVFWLNWLAEGRTPEEIKALQAQLCWLGVVAALGVGAFVGFINGLLVARIGIPSIIATLATAFVWRGMAVFLVGGKQFSLRDFNQTELWAVTTGRLFTGLFAAAWCCASPTASDQAVVVLAIAVLLWFILNRHRFGEFVAVHRRQRQRGAGGRHRRQGDAGEAVHAHGRACRPAELFLTMETENFTTTQGKPRCWSSSPRSSSAAISIFGGSASSAAISASSSWSCCRSAWSPWAWAATSRTW